jgi:hypothetical protein
MVTKYNIGDRIKTKKFDGVVTMITITKKGTRYRAYGTRTYDSYTLNRCQEDIWEHEIVEIEEK